MHSNELPHLSPCNRINIKGVSSYKVFHTFWWDLLIDKYIIPEMEMIDQMETNIFNNAITINGGISEHINNFWGGGTNLY